MSAYQIVAKLAIDIFKQFGGLSKAKKVDRLIQLVALLYYLYMFLGDDFLIML